MRSFQGTLKSWSMASPRTAGTAVKRLRRELKQRVRAVVLVPIILRVKFAEEGMISDKTQRRGFSSASTAAHNENRVRLNSNFAARGSQIISLLRITGTTGHCISQKRGNHPVAATFRCRKVMAINFGPESAKTHLQVPGRPQSRRSVCNDAAIIKKKAYARISPE